MRFTHLHDIVHAARSLARARTFTAVCVTSLGLGMGVAIAILLLVRRRAGTERESHLIVGERLVDDSYEDLLTQSAAGGLLAAVALILAALGVLVPTGGGPLFARVLLQEEQETRSRRIS